MNRLNARPGMAFPLIALFALFSACAAAQVPVDEDGNAIGGYEAATNAVGNEDIPLLSPVELEELVGPIALYPDDLLAIVLPASAYPLQIVDAARFLEAHEADPSLEPDPDWDDSVVALLNYPEVVELLNEDIDWTWRLGEAVIAQQTDVVGAIETFRDRAYAAGNLKSDEYQQVTRNEGVIEIAPVHDDVIYVPYYEPERVVVYQPRPVYYYYPRAYPVYYYPYSSAYDFDRGYFWGVTTAFTIGWLTDSLHVYHHSYYGHPYYGYTYRSNWWYRRPTVTVYNTTYVRNTNVTVNRYYSGDAWHPRANRRDYVSDHRVTRNRYYPSSGSTNLARSTTYTRNNESRYDQAGRQTTTVRRQVNEAATRTTTRSREPITFRERPATASARQAPQRVARNDRAASSAAGTTLSNRTAHNTTQTRREPPAQRVARQSTPSSSAVRTEAARVRQEQPATRHQPERRTVVAQNTQRSQSVQRAQPAQRQPARESRPAPQRAEQPARASRPVPQRAEQPARQERSESQRPAQQEKRSTERADRSETRKSGRRR